MIILTDPQEYPSLYLHRHGIYMLQRAKVSFTGQHCLWQRKAHCLVLQALQV